MLFGQLQQDQQTAWNNYLNDWYNREQTAAIDDIAAQTAFDTADNTSYTARMETLEESRRQHAFDAYFGGYDPQPLTSAEWGLAEIPYATTHGASEVTWITATANTARTRKREEATGQHTYETALATQSKNYSFALTPLEKTRQAANATAQTVYWNSETTAANARRTGEYGAIGDYRSADYAERAQEVAALAAFTKPFNTGNVGLSSDLWQPLPYMQFQVQIANAKTSWWNASDSLEFSQQAGEKNTADSAEQAGNINGLRDHLHIQPKTGVVGGDDAAGDPIPNIGKDGVFEIQHSPNGAQTVGDSWMSYFRRVTYKWRCGSSPTNNKGKGCSHEKHRNGDRFARLLRWNRHRCREGHRTDDELERFRSRQGTFGQTSRGHHQHGGLAGIVERLEIGR